MTHTLMIKDVASTARYCLHAWQRGSDTIQNTVFYNINRHDVDQLQSNTQRNQTVLKMQTLGTIVDRLCQASDRRRIYIFSFCNQEWNCVCSTNKYSQKATDLNNYCYCP